MIAGLPMYDWPEVASSHDALWSLIAKRLRDEGIDAPDRLTREPGLWQLWTAPDLLLGQVCGLPFREKLADKVSLIGALDYGLPDTPPGHYHSVFVTRRGDATTLSDYARRTFAFNGQDSQSGWAAAQNYVTNLGFRFNRLLHTGAHVLSAKAVTEKSADIACIDAITWRLIEAHRPEIARACQVISRTDPTPGQALITAFAGHVSVIAGAITDALAALPDADASALGLTRDLIPLKREAYLAVPTPGLLSQDAPAA